MIQRVYVWLGRYWHWLCLAAMGLFPVRLFRSGLLMAMGEGTKPQDYAGFYQYFDYFSWSNQLNLGQPNFWTPHLFPFDAIFLVLRTIGLPFQLVQMGWGIFLWSLAAVGMYFFITSLVPEHRLVRLWGVIAAAVYVFNPFTVQFVFNENIRLVYLALPLSLGLFIRGLRARQSMPYAIGIGLVSLLYATAAVNPPTVFPLWVALGVVAVWGVGIAKVSIRHTMALLVWSLVWFVLLNSWWLFIVAPAALTIAETAEEVLAFSSPSTGVWEIFRFLGSWGFRATHQGVPYFAYNPLYHGASWLVNFASYAVPAIGLIALANKKLLRPTALLSGILLVGFALTKGTAKPFGEAYEWVWQNVPFFWIFREPYTKFTPLVIVGVAALCGAAVAELLLWLAARQQKIIRTVALVSSLAVVLALIGAASWPLLSRQTPRQTSQKSLKMAYYQLPEYWQETGAWFAANDPHSRVLVLPRSSYGDPYNWPPEGTGTAGTAAKFLIPNPLITYRDALTEAGRASNAVYQLITPTAPKNLFWYLRFFDVRYMLQLNDLDWENAEVSSPADIATALQGQFGITKQRSFGLVDVYRTDELSMLPRIYAPDTIYRVGGVATLREAVFGIAPQLPPTGRPAIVLAEAPTVVAASFPQANITVQAPAPVEQTPSAQTLATQMPVIPVIITPPVAATVPTVQFNYVTPDHYQLKIDNITQSFPLVFAETFHSHWQLLPAPQSTWQRFTQALFPRGLELSHGEVNIGGNMWWVDMAELERRGVLQPTGDGTWSAELVLVFTLRAWLYWGFIVSGVSLLVAMSILIRWLASQRRLANVQ